MGLLDDAQQGLGGGLLVLAGGLLPGLATSRGTRLRARLTFLVGFVLGDLATLLPLALLPALPSSTLLRLAVGVSGVVAVNMWAVRDLRARPRQPVGPARPPGPTTQVPQPSSPARPRDYGPLLHRRPED